MSALVLFYLHDIIITMKPYRFGIGTQMWRSQTGYWGINPSVYFTREVVHEQMHMKRLFVIFFHGCKLTVIIMDATEHKTS
jgi:hypothetical protein